jgi:hypothetical protein
LDAAAVEALVSDLHPRIERAHRRKIFDREANGLGRCREAAMLTPLAFAAPRFARYISAGNE